MHVCNPNQGSRNTNKQKQKQNKTKTLNQEEGRKASCRDVLGFTLEHRAFHELLETLEGALGGLERGVLGEKLGAIIQLVDPLQVTVQILHNIDADADGCTSK